MNEVAKIILKNKNILLILISIILLVILNSLKDVFFSGEFYERTNRYISWILDLLIIIQKIKLIKHIYKDLIDENYRANLNIKRAIINYISSNLAIAIQMFPFIIGFVVIELFKRNSIINFSNEKNDLIFLIVTTPYLYLFIFTLVIASVEDIGWFPNTKSSFMFIRENNGELYKLIIIYLFPQVILYISNAFLPLDNQEYILYKSLIEVVKILIFPALCYKYFVINFKNKKLLINNM